MPGYFGVSVIHQTLRWTTGSLTWVCDLFACVYTQSQGTLVYNFNRRTFIESAQNLTLEKSWSGRKRNVLPKNWIQLYFVVLYWSLIIHASRTIPRTQAEHSSDPPVCSSSVEKMPHTKKKREKMLHRNLRNALVNMSAMSMMVKHT